MQHRNFQKLLRWISAFLTAICASYIGTAVYSLYFPLFGSKSSFLPLEEIYIPYQLEIFTSLWIISLTTAFFYRNTIRTFFYDYLRIGRSGYKANLKIIFDRSAYQNDRVYGQIQDDVDYYVESAKDIDLLLISGAEKKNDPFENYVISKIEEVSKNNGKNICVLALHPKSLFVSMRARERFTDKNDIDEYIRQHSESTNYLIRELKNKVLFYDSYPIWRIFRLGDLIYISRYLERRSALETISMAYYKPGLKADRRMIENPYSSFVKYLEFLKAQAKNPRAPLEVYLAERAYLDTTKGITDACCCYKCTNDIKNIIEKRLKKEGHSFVDLQGNGQKEEYYVKARDKVFSKKHCALPTPF